MLLAIIILCIFVVWLFGRGSSTSTSGTNGQPKATAEDFEGNLLDDDD